MALKSVSIADPNYVPNYQLSAIPYVTSSAGSEVTDSPISVDFPYVTKFVTVHNTGGGDLRIGFTEDGVNGAITKNYFVLDTTGAGKDPAFTFDVRCKQMWFRRDASTDTDFSLFAGLTPVEASAFPVITGSNGFEGVG
jgi:hypothetical protein